MPLQPTYSSATGLTSPAANGTNPVSVLAAFPNNMLVCRNGSTPVGFMANLAGYPQLPYTFFAINLDPTRGDIGSILWMKTYNPLPGNLTYSYGGADPTASNGNGKGVFVFALAETRNWIGFSMSTGELLWGPTASQPAFDYYGNPILPYVTGQVAYGNLYSSGFAGVTYAYNLTNGKVLWTYGNGGAGNSTNAGLTTFYGDYPTFIQAVGNGIIYLATTEHTINDPIYKGSLARAINATNGQEIWTLSGYTGEFGSMSYAIADGYNLWFNGYDDQLYTVGRGPSALTVEAPKIGVDLSKSIVISGTVTDTSAGTKQDEQAARFPNGVPLASDSSMSDLMGYVYQQKPLPSTFTGVDITIDVIDSNGNYRNIGTATTDASGTYSLRWVPDIEGKYTVKATFHGTKGYWPSFSETSFAVDSAQPTASPYPTANLPPTEMYVVGMGVAIIIVIVILGVLILRKRP